MTGPHCPNRSIPEWGPARTQLRPTERLSTLDAKFLLGDGDDRPCNPVPCFWTDQFVTKIHVHGTLCSDAEVSLVEGSVTGVLGWNMPKQARLRRPVLTGALVGGKP